MTDARSDLRRQPVAGRDGVWLQDSSTNLMVINAVFTTDRLDRETFRDLWAERVMRAGGGRRFDRFTRRIVFVGRRAYWQEDPDFDLDRHVVLAPPLEGDPLALSTRRALQDYVGRLASEPLPWDRPLWQFQIVPEYRDGMSAVYCRIHHVMADGMALVPLLFSLMDPDPEVGRPGPLVAKVSGFEKVVAAALAGPFLLAQKFLWRPDRSPVHGSPLAGRKRVGWTDPIPVEVIKAVKNAAGATLNDVLMACVSAAFDRYVTARTGAPLKQLRVSMPVNVRPLGEEPRMENKFAAVMLDLPVGFADIRERVAATKRRLDAVKRSPEPLFTYGTVRLLLGTLPAAVSRLLIDYLANKCTCVISNVPGPWWPIYLGGRRMRAMMFWVPQRADIGIGISILSLSGELMVGVICDVELVAEPQELMEGFSAEFERLKASLGL